MGFSSNLTVLSLAFTTVLLLSSASPLRYEISEELPINYTVANIKSDLSRRSSHSAATLSLLRYRLRSDSSYVRIDSVTGELFTKSVIDRDKICYMEDICERTVDVIVEPRQYYDIVAVVVSITDINDNSPQFPRDSVRVEVLESTAVGAAFPLPSADDEDGEEFAVKEYRMEDRGQRKFRLNYTKQADGSDQVRLRLVESLDREQESNYSMRIVALDGGTPPKSANLEVLIVVKDANDNPPRLANENYATLEENLRLGTAILQIKAEDPDEGMNGNLTYAFTDDTLIAHGDIFGIVAGDGWIFLKGVVDYERERSLVLTVVVADQGPMPLTAYTRVVIYVSDVNDNAPLITVNNMPGRQNAEVRENLLPGAFVSHIVVSDADGGDNGKVECAIDTSLFRLVTLQDTNSEYKLVNAVQFNREETPEETLTISCHDQGTPTQLSSSLTIKVKIVDENDNSPKFKDDRITVRLRENNDNGTQLTKLIVTDADEGVNAELDFRIESIGDSPLSAIAINQQRYVIATTVFDYEERQEYSYLIVATDRGTPSRRSSTAALNIRIEDVNDERPSFEVDSYVFRTVENLPMGTVIGKVRAWDDDLTPSHRNIYYSFVDDTPYLSIDSVTGEIVNTKVIDREETSSLKVKVRASNSQDDPSSSGSISSEVSVKFYVDDENDNSPVITFPSSLNRTIVLPPLKELRTGHRLAKVEAFDVDEGLNATLSFSTDETTDAARYFGVEASTGWITITDDSIDDAIADVGGFHLVVRVADRGSPPRSLTETLNILAAGASEVSVQHSRSLGALESGWMVVVVGVGCGVLTIAVVVAVALICVRVHRCKIKNSHKYNCRLEASRATSSGSLNRYGARASGLDGGQAEGFASQGSRGKGKKGVRFNLDQEQGPCISAPIIDSKLTCPFPDECAFHRQDSSTSSSNDSPRLETIHEPLYTFRSTANGNRYPPPCPVEFMARLPRHPQPIILPMLQPRNGTLRKVDIPKIDQNLFKVNCDQAGPVRSPSSYSVGGRPSSSLAERWSSGSLPDSGRGPSDEDDPVFYPGSQEPFFPAESNV